MSSSCSSSSTGTTITGSTVVSLRLSFPRSRWSRTISSSSARAGRSSRRTPRSTRASSSSTSSSPTDGTSIPSRTRRPTTGVSAEARTAPTTAGRSTSRASRSSRADDRLFDAFLAYLLRIPVLEAWPGRATRPVDRGLVRDGPHAAAGRRATAGGATAARPPRCARGDHHRPVRARSSHIDAPLSGSDPMTGDVRSPGSERRAPDSGRGGREITTPQQPER